MNTRCQVGQQAASEADARTTVKAIVRAGISTEPAHAMYVRLAKEAGEHAAKLKTMYDLRKVRQTPVTEALWAGYWAVKERAELMATRAAQSKVPQ